jgi:hypothetical protein
MPTVSSVAHSRSTAEVKQRFADSPVKLAQLGSTYEFHSADPAVVPRTSGMQIYIRLARDGRRRRQGEMTASDQGRNSRGKPLSRLVCRFGPWAKRLPQ